MASFSNDDLFLPKILNNSIEQSKDTHLESNYNNEKDFLELIDLKNINKSERNFKNINITNSTMLDKLSSIKKKESKSSLNIHTNSNSNNLNNNSSQNKLEKYQKHIFNLEQKITQIDSNYMKQIYKLNEEINIKNKNLKYLSNINKNLKISLNSLTKKLDELLYKFTKDQKKLKPKNNNISEKDKNFEEQLLLKEKELKHQQNMINILSNDNKKLKHSLEIQNNYEINRNLSDKLCVKEQEIVNLKKIIKDYEHKYEKHNECQKEIDLLKIKLLNNQKELSEKKKEIFISHKNITELQSKYINSESAVNLINKTIKERNIKKKEKLIVNMKLINNSRKNKKTLSPQIKHRELSEDNKNSKISDISNNLNYNIIYNIFTEEEIDIIKKLYEYKYYKFQDFIKKVEILEKYQSSKDKAYIVTIRKLNMKIDEYIEQNNLAEISLKEKDNKILCLTRQLKDLIKKKKDLYENNKKLIVLLNNITKRYKEEKKAKIELANLLLELQNKSENNSNIKENKIMKEIDLDINENIIINTINNSINKENINNENKNDSVDKNILLLKEILKENPINKEIIQKERLLPNKSKNLPIKKDSVISEKDLELESIVSQNTIETPKNKKQVQYQINSNINHVEIKGIKNKINREVLFETQPKENKKKLAYSIGVKNNKQIINRGTLLSQFKTIDKVNNNIKDLKRYDLKNDIKRSMRRMSLINRDKSESAIIDLLNNEKKVKKTNNFKTEKNIKIEKFGDNANSKISILFED